MHRPTDPHAVVKRLYELISGPAEERRDWTAVRDLFVPTALLRSELVLPDGRYQSGCWTVPAFCEAAAADYRAQGFWEDEICAQTQRFGQIAHVWSTYESRVGSPDAEPLRGINSVQLLEQGGEWRITGLVFQIERGTAGIPDEFLAADRMAD